MLNEIDLRVLRSDAEWKAAWGVMASSAKEQRFAREVLVLLDEVARLERELTIACAGATSARLGPCLPERADEDERMFVDDVAPPVSKGERRASR